MFKSSLFVMSLVSLNVNAGEKVIIFDPSTYSFQAIEDDKVVRQGKASGGRLYCPDIKRSCKTPKGNFEVIGKKGKFYRSPLYPLNCDNKSKTNKCAKMPYALKFRSSGESFHASDKDKWDKPSHISHGCIHLQMEDAKWLNEEFAEIGTKVVVLPYPTKKTKRNK